MRLKVIGDRSRFNAEIIAGIEAAESLTAGNSGLTLTIAADYGGRWDILQAVNKLLAAGKKEITESDLNAGLMLGDVPEPDLFIRTGGEMRISNFLLWQMAYAELYFTDTLWPDFDSQAFQTAIASGEFVLGSTLERFVLPAHMAGRLEGKNSPTRSSRSAATAPACSQLLSATSISGPSSSAATWWSPRPSNGRRSSPIPARYRG